MAEEETVEEVEEEQIGTDDIYHDVEHEDDIAKGDTLDTTKTMIVGDIDDIATDYDEQGEAVEEEKEEEEVEEKEESEVEPPPEPEMYTVKVDGSEARVTQDQLIAGYQKAAASDQRFQAASQMEKNAKGVLSKFLNPEDAVGALTDLYRDHFSGDQEQAQEAVDKIVGNRVTQLMELESMTDEQREIHTLREEKNRLQEEMDMESSQRRYEEEAQRVHAGNQTAVPLLDNSIKKFDLEMGSPEDVEASETLAGYVRQGQAVTQELADQVVKDVVTRKRQLLQDSVSGMSAEDLMTTNPELAEALRDKSIEQIKESRATKAAKPKRAPTKKRRKRDEKTLDTVSSNDFFNETDW